MSILGHDCHGRPLKAGDLVMYVGRNPYHHGQSCTVRGPAPDGSSDVEVSIPHPGKFDYFDAEPHTLMKLTDTGDWQPLERSAPIAEELGK